MKSAQIEFFRTLLLGELNALRLAAGKTVNGLRDGGGKLADPLDRAAVELDRHIELSIRDRERAVMEEIKGALARMDRDEFGICDRCGRDIGEKRLRVRPTCRLCLICQERREMNARQPFPGKVTGSGNDIAGFRE
ncbi:MAG: TraR/DksA C4-type zinc finger protein [Syntrophobacterales bacterium]|nr:TraR/DksA C4-type zinc finger protein [Syntrophobacterales bacterium]